MPTYTQLELDLWGNLKSALNQPDGADFYELWQDLQQFEIEPATKKIK